jgi:hypothetical protein
MLCMYVRMYVCMQYVPSLAPKRWEDFIHIGFLRIYPLHDNAL